MRRTKRAISFITAFAVVAVCLAVGIGNIAANAAATGTITAVIHTKDALGAGTASDFYFKILYSDSTPAYNGFIDGQGEGDPLEQNNTDTFIFTDVVINKNITGFQIVQKEKVNTAIWPISNSDWDFDWCDVFLNINGTNVQVAARYDTDKTFKENGDYNAWNTSWFSAHNHTLTFNANGGTGGGTQEMVYGAAPVTPPSVSRTGYTLTGWSPAIPSFAPDSNQTYTAQWSANTYTVAFSAGTGHVSPDSKMVTYGSTYGAGTGGWPTPAKTGYTFDGWYTGFDGTGTKIVGSDTVNTAANLTLHAKWVPNTYTVTYNGNGHTGGSTPNSNHTYDAIGYPSINGYVRLGHSFLGWSLSQSAAAPTYLTGQAMSNLTAVPNGIVTFFAVWKVNTYNVTFHANGGTGSMAAQSYVFGTTSALNTAGYGRTGCTFQGWATTQANANAGIVAYENNAVYTMATEGASLYAVWKANTYTVTFDAKGGLGGWSAVMAYGSPITAPTVTKDGHVFIGWDPYVPATVPAGNVTCEALWAVLSYKITFNANGGTGGTINTLSYGSVLTPPTVTKPGYTFAGWLPEVPATVPAADAEYVAQWVPNGSVIVFDANGGTGGDTYVLEAGTVLTPPTVARQGYTFTGWSPAVPATVPSENTIYTAQWSANSYTISFDANGGTESTSGYMVFGTPLTAPAVSRTGYTFAGWSPAVPATVPAQNATYTAQWNVNSYIITFDANGGTGSKSQPMNYGVSLTAPVVTRDGYTFAGWSPAVPATVPAMDATYTAQWSLNTATVQFDLNGGTGTVPEAQTGEPGAAVTLPAQGDIAREYFNFLGWAQQPDAMVPLVSFIIPEAGATLYAVWSRVPVELEEADGSTTVINNGEKLIFGLEEGLTKNGFAADFVRVNGDATLRYTYVSDSFGTGTVVELVDNVTGEVVETYTVIIFGDVDGDGFITVADENIIDMVSSYQLELTNEAFLFAADLTQDGFVDAFDLNILSAATSYTATIDQTNPSGM